MRGSIVRSRYRRGLLLLLAPSLFVVIFALRLRVDGAEEPVGLLFTIPIALVAIAVGAIPAIAAALLSLALLGIYDAVSPDSITPVGYLTPGVAFLILAWLVGTATSLAREMEYRLIDLEGWLEDPDQMQGADSPHEQGAALDREVRRPNSP